MKDLHYATVATDRHHVVVATWEDPDGTLWFKMSVDGVLLEEGTLDDEQAS